MRNIALLETINPDNSFNRPGWLISLFECKERPEYIYITGTKRVIVRKECQCKSEVDQKFGVNHKLRQKNACLQRRSQNLENIDQRNPH